MIKEMLLEIVLTLLGAGLTIGTFYLNRYLRKLEIIADEKFNIELLTKTIERLNDAVIDVVTSIEETTAKELRKLVKAGKLNKEELEKLSGLALIKIKSQVGEAGIKLLEDSIGNVNEMIRDKIESYLRKIKLENELGGALAPKKSK